MFILVKVTICPINPISNEKSLQFSKMIFNGVNKSMLVHDYHWRKYYITTLVGAYNNDSKKLEFGSPLDELIIDCGFNQNHCNMSSFKVN